MPLTVLIASAGRQTTLVDAFHATPFDVTVFAVDTDPCAAALAAADEAWVAPPFTRPDYADWLVRLCGKQRVGVLLTLNELELHHLERIRDRLAEGGTRLLGMPTAALERCTDKRRHPALAAAVGLRVPDLWKPEHITSIPPATFPVVLKQATGRGSRGLVVANDAEEAARFFKVGPGRRHVADYMVQPLLSGVEYGMDIVNDLAGNPRAVFQRRKVRMRAGETDVATTVVDERLQEVGTVLGRALGHSGVVDVDVIRTGGVEYLLDINPRFGGGYVFSHAAGANVPAALVAWHLEIDHDPAWLEPRPGLTYARVSTLQRIGPDRGRDQGGLPGYLPPKCDVPKGTCAVHSTICRIDVDAT